MFLQAKVGYYSLTTPEKTDNYEECFDKLSNLYRKEEDSRTYLSSWKKEIKNRKKLKSINDTLKYNHKVIVEYATYVNSIAPPKKNAVTCTIQ